MRKWWKTSFWSKMTMKFKSGMLKIPAWLGFYVGNTRGGPLPLPAVFSCAFEACKPLPSVNSAFGTTQHAAPHNNTAQHNMTSPSSCVAVGWTAGGISHPCWACVNTMQEGGGGDFSPPCWPAVLICQLPHALPASPLRLLSAPPPPASREPSMIILSWHAWMVLSSTCPQQCSFIT